MMVELVGHIACGAVLAEGIQWHQPSDTLWWTDIQSSRLWCWSEAQGARSFTMPERLGAFAFTNVMDVFLCAFETGIAKYHLRTAEIEWLHRPEQGATGRRFNDGRCDRQGRFWSGTMVEDENLAPQNSATLYCMGLDGDVTDHLTDIAISNGLCWSPEGTTLYFADSPTRTIRAFDFDRDEGRLSRPRFFAKMADGAFPDGANVDSAGCVWSALWGAGKIVRLTPDGVVDQFVDVPVPQPTCVAFGGSDFKYMFVSSARDGLDERVLKDAPRSGDIFIYQLDVAGLPEMRYEGL